MQSIALGGAIVTGSLARKRRLKLEQLNIKLRQVNAELMKRHSPAVSLVQPHLPGLSLQKLVELVCI